MELGPGGAGGESGLLGGGGERERRRTMFVRGCRRRRRRIRLQGWMSALCPAGGLAIDGAWAMGGLWLWAVMPGLGAGSEGGVGSGRASGGEVGGRWRSSSSSAGSGGALTRRSASRSEAQMGASWRMGLAPAVLSCRKTRIEATCCGGCLSGWGRKTTRLKKKFGRRRKGKGGESITGRGSGRGRFA